MSDPNPKVVDLMAALERSVAAAKEARRPVVSPQPEPAQDPPQDVQRVLVAALGAGMLGAALAESALGALTDAGLAVVYADVPHGSRAEQVGWWDAADGALWDHADLTHPAARRCVPVYALAPPVEGDEK